jgi:heme exporter protein A
MTVYENVVTHCSGKTIPDAIGCKNEAVGHNPPLLSDGDGGLTTEQMLRGQDLAVWRGERCLFEALHFELHASQLALLVGPNGSGKTTLLRILAGLAEPTAGTATWNGTTIGELEAEERGALAYRGHLEALKRDLTVAENLEVHAALWGGQGDYREILAELRLGDVADTRVRYLSAGQRRRASLATLRVSGAKLWLLDEPTTNLDGEGRAVLRDWTSRHLAGGGLAVIATHQSDEFARPGVLMIEL